MSARRCVAVALAGCGLVGVWLRGDALAADAAAREVADMVAASIRKNFEPLKSFTATIRQVKVLPSSLKPGVKSQPVSGGGTLTMTLLAEQETVTEAYVRDGQQYYDTRDPIVPMRQWVNDGVITQWETKHNLVVKGADRPEYFEQFANWDPREMGFWQRDYRPVEVIENGEILHASLAESGWAHIEVKVPKGDTLIFDCASENSFLPRRIFSRDKDGRIYMRSDLEYAQVKTESGSIWLLSKMVQRAPTQVIKETESPAWESTESTTATTTVSDVVVGGAIPDKVFEIPTFPDKTYVRNVDQPEADGFVAHRSSARPDDKPGVNAWIVLNVVGVTALASLVIWKRLLRPQLPTKGSN